LAGSCYSNMFRGCTSLAIRTATDAYAFRIPDGAETGTEASNALSNMFIGIGTATGLSDLAPATPSINTTYYTPNKPVGSVM